MEKIIRLLIGLVVLTIFRIIYIFVTHGPVWLEKKVYNRAQYSELFGQENFVGLFYTEVLIAILFIIGFYIFPFAQKGILYSSLLGLWMGILIYLPQNLMNCCLFDQFDRLILKCFFGVGIIGGMFSGIILYFLLPENLF